MSHMQILLSTSIDLPLLVTWRGGLCDAILFLSDYDLDYSISYAPASRTPYISYTPASPTFPHFLHPRISYAPASPTTPRLLHPRIFYAPFAMSYTSAPTPLHLYTSASRHLLHTASPLYPFRNHLPTLISRPSRLRLLLSRSGLRYA